MSRAWLLEVTVACACHVVVRVMLRTARLQTALGMCRRRLPVSRRPFTLPELQQVAALSRRVCRGSCLTESLVLGWLGTRHGHPPLPLAIAVKRLDGRLQAHAWSGGGAAPPGFVPLWSDPGKAPETRGDPPAEVRKGQP